MGNPHAERRLRTSIVCAILALYLLACGRVGFGMENTSQQPGGVSSFDISLAPTSISPGTSFPLRVRALDGQGAVVPDYRGTIAFSSSDTQAGFPPPYSFTPVDQGAAIIAGFSLDTVGEQTIMVNDGSATGTSPPITVAAAVASTLVLSGLPATTSIGAPHILNVEVRDQFGNVALDYIGQVLLSSTDNTALLPDSLVLSAAEQGRASFVAPLRFGSVGDFSVQASEATLVSATLQTRVTAPEARRGLVRSIGQDTESESGGATLTITGSTAIFDGPVNFAVVVGDALSYTVVGVDGATTTRIAIVSGVVDSRTYGLLDVLGLPITTTQVASGYKFSRAYRSLSAALSAEENPDVPGVVRNFDRWTRGRDLPANNEAWTFVGHDGVDTLPASTEEWSTTRGNCLAIASPVGPSQSLSRRRHAGHWDSRFYQLAVDSTVPALLIQGGCITLTGLQIEQQGAGAGVEVLGAADSSIDKTLLRGRGTALVGIQVGSSLAVDITNTIVYGFATGITATNVTTLLRLRSNTVVDYRTVGIQVGGSTIAELINNLVNRPNDGMTSAAYSLNMGEGAPGSNLTNLSQDNTSPNVATRNRIVNFHEPTRADYRLAYSDTSAADAGTTVANFNDDVGGRLRLSQWDIGADERPRRVFRSVGPNSTGALAIGDDANTLTITDGNALFDLPLPTNVGLGDVLVVLDQLYFVAGRQNPLSFALQRADGQRVTAIVSGTISWQIFRAYTSLDNASKAIENIDLPPTIGNFDTWVGGADLLAANQQWNIACYADAIDTTAAHFRRWNTDERDFLRIFTPTGLDEVGVTQRHDGTNGGGGYHLQVLTPPFDSALNIQAPHAQVEGLRVSVGSSPRVGIWLSGVGAHWINGNVISDTVAQRTAADLGMRLPSGQGVLSRVYIWNNVVNGFGTGIAWTSNNSVLDGAIDNNTVVNATERGIALAGTPEKNNLALRNNLVAGPGADYVVVGMQQTANNISTDDTSPDVAHRSKTVGFVDPAAGDYHLDPLTAGDAVGAGVVLNADPTFPFATDIDGEQRDVVWDIGADQAGP